MANVIRVERIPKIDLTEQGLKRLKAAYNLFKNGENVSLRAIMAELRRGDLPKDFEPTDVDQRLIRFGTTLTLLGAWYADPTSKILEKAGTVICAVRDMLLSQPEKERVTAAEIAEKTEIALAKVARLFYLILPLGDFSAGASGSSRAPGWTEITINDDAFKEYSRYESIENLLCSFAERYDPTRREDDADAWFDEPTSTRQTKVDRAIQRLKNHRIFWPIIVSAIILVAAITFFELVVSVVGRVLGWFR